MTPAPSFPLRFAGRVLCRRDSRGPLNLTLSGRLLDAPEEPLLLAFAASAPDGLPELLQDAEVEQTGPRRFRICSSAGEWTLDGAAHVHRDATAELASVLPARAVPWHKRLFWRLLLAVAANRAARRLILR
jgi:hypothetical protein